MARVVLWTRGQGTQPTTGQCALELRHTVPMGMRPCGNGPGTSRFTIHACVVNSVWTTQQRHIREREAAKLGGAFLSLKGAGCKVNTDVIGGERLLLSACKQGYKTTRPLRTMATWPQVALLPLTTEPVAHADEPAFRYGHVMWRCLQVSLSACLQLTLSRRGQSAHCTSRRDR
jgi:hypothetical protein